MQLWQAGRSKSDVTLLGRLILIILCSLLMTVLLPSPMNWVPALAMLLSVTLYAQHLKKCQDDVRFQLITLSNTLSLAVSGGQDFSVALQFYTANEKGLLADECREALGRLRLGQDRDTAFLIVVDRYPVTRDFFAAIRLSERQGTPLAVVLKEQARRLRQKRLFEAETRAQKLPILLMGPLTLCIFPNVFLALLGPYLITIL